MEVIFNSHSINYICLDNRFDLKIQDDGSAKVLPIIHVYVTKLQVEPLANRDECCQLI